jgi:hypothetical protein
MSGANTQACMGGFCTQRGQCADYLQADRLAQEPSQRKCPRGQEAPVALHGTARDRILAALTAAGSDGVRRSALLGLAPARGMEKALIKGVKAGAWFSNGRGNNMTRYFLRHADMLVAMAAEERAMAEAKRARDRNRKRVRVRASGKPVKHRANAKASVCKTAREWRQEPEKPKPDTRPVVVPATVNVHRIPTPPSRYALSRVEPIFSGLHFGMYYPAETAVTRAYAQGGAL